MPTANGAGPLVAAGTDTLLLQLDHPEAEACRRSLARFAQLERSPGLVETYRLTDLGLWNAKASGLDHGAVLATIEGNGSGPVPHTMASRIVETMDRFGPVTVEDGGDGLVLRAHSAELLRELLDDPELSSLVGHPTDEITVPIDGTVRGRVKLALTRLRRPADDRAALRPGEPIDIGLRTETELRPYQRDAVAAWLPSGTGVIVLPCGAGKTLTALAALAEVGTTTLILTTGGASMTQWERELARFTTISSDDVGRYGAGHRQVRPITLATYQMLATRRDGAYHNLELVEEHDWGLVIYDEVHLLPAPVFRVTADLQARRRLGLTATLVREDGHEDDVFALVGPKKADVPWKELEREGWIATATCAEVRVPMTEALRLNYALADRRKQFRIAAENDAKIPLIKRLLARHSQSPTLVIGMSVEQMKRIAEELEIPLLSGSTAAGTRDRLFGAFRDGSLPVLAVTKVANFAIDLPDAAVAIQVSGTFGSRQEEAQRLGRVLRPKSGDNQAFFYSLVSADSAEQDFALRRQLFLCEQGYSYGILDPEDL